MPNALIRHLGVGLFFFPSIVFGCATCGLSETFTPKMFFISLGFVVLPLTFAGFIGYRLWREQKSQNSNQDAEV